MKALIDNNLVVQVSDNPFDIAPPFFWVDCDSSVVAYEYTYNGSSFVEIPKKEHKPTNEEIKAARQVAYAAEADPIFFMSQRGEATQQEWLDKIAEIKAKFPYNETTGS